jgi:transcriptional regulator with XRE-family HTH domain
MDTLKKYMRDNGLTTAGFARLSKIPAVTIWRYMTGKNSPSALLALRIEQATGGAVTRMELLYPGEEKAGEAAEPR